MRKETEERVEHERTAQGANSSRLTLTKADRSREMPAVQAPGVVCTSPGNNYWLRKHSA